MITQRKTIIPIFNYKLTIVIFDRWEELEGSIPQDEMDTEANAITPTDVYVAINSQYHDYVELFKSWFGDNVDQKIIESAIIFWFKDVDCKSRNKVVSYFKEY
jgi:hypothetical protein